MASDGHEQHAMRLWREDTAPARTQVPVTPPTHRHEPLSNEAIAGMDSTIDAVEADPVQLPTRADFQTLDGVVEYLRGCRARKLLTGDWSFESQGEDRTPAVRTFFRTHPECQVSINGAQRFITLSDRAVERINAQLPEGIAKLDPMNPVVMANKFSL